MHGTKIPMSRVVPVNKSVAHSIEVFPYEEAVEIVKRAKNIALGQCQCRFAARNCDAPLDVCLLLDGWADFLIDRGLAQPISVQEAMEALERAEKAGLVHMTSNTKTPVPYICNCCSCCCFMLRGVTQLGRKTLASSRFFAVVDGGDCVGCGECVEVCGFKAVEMDDQNVARVIQESCLGCGLCASVCPEDTISMALRTGAAEPYDTGSELILDIARDREKLDSFTSS
jgi:ferredoxin